jgi:hypothetical protein
MSQPIQPPRIASYALISALALLSACKRGVAPAVAAEGGPAAPSAPVAATPPAPSGTPAAAMPSVDPRWPSWLPPVAGVTVRMADRELLEAYADRPDLAVLIDTRRALEAAGYTVSQTNMRRSPYENRFVFTATRAEAFVYVRLTGNPRRPGFTTFSSAQGRLARTLQRSDG